MSLFFFFKWSYLLLIIGLLRDWVINLGWVQSITYFDCNIKVLTRVSIRIVRYRKWRWWATRFSNTQFCSLCSVLCKFIMTSGNEAFDRFRAKYSDSSKVLQKATVTYVTHHESRSFSVERPWERTILWCIIFWKPNHDNKKFLLCISAKSLLV